MQTSLIREMSRLASAHGAINLTQGFPDHPAPEWLKIAAIEAITSDDNQYSDDWGTAPLREAVASEYRGHVGVSFDPETEVTITCGSSEATVVALLAICEPGDEVILLEPFYENYRHAVAIAGAVPRFVRTLGNQGPIEPDDLAAAFNDHTKAIILNSPNNPSGHVLSHEELEVIADLCVKWDSIAISDEIYRRLVYDGDPFESIVSLPHMRTRTIVLDGLSKTYGVTGWRVGWALASSVFSTPLREFHTRLTLGAPTPFQVAGVHALRSDSGYYQELHHRYRRSRDLLSTNLARIGFEHVVPRGAFYVFTQFPSLGDEDDYAFCLRLVRDVGVAAVPGRAFLGRSQSKSKFIRFSFSKSEEQLSLAIERLNEIGKSWHQSGEL